jgi:hypothetical protein
LSNQQPNVFVTEQFVLVMIPGENSNIRIFTSSFEGQYHIVFEDMNTGKCLYDIISVNDIKAKYGFNLDDYFPKK